jgi:hypothetical protein
VKRLPVYSGSAEQDELNKFLRGRRIIQTRKELISKEGAARWFFLRAGIFYHREEEECYAN